MAIEGVNEGSYEEQKKKGLMSESFHLDPDKGIDPIEKLVEKLGPNGAFDELADQLPPDTNPDVVRQMKLVLNQVIKRHQQ